MNDDRHRDIPNPDSKSLPKNVLRNIALGLASFPNDLGVMLLIVGAVAGASILTPDQLDMIRTPIANGIMMVILYYGVITTARIFSRPTGVHSGKDFMATGHIRRGISVSRTPVSESEMR